MTLKKVLQPAMLQTQLLLLLVLALGLADLAGAYNPALPSNDTSGFNVAAEDYIQINWQPSGQSSYNDALSLVLQQYRRSPIGGYRGALVHFDDANATTVPTGTPWIALVSCDNVTPPSSFTLGTQVDTFTLASQMGALAAIAYSTTASTCAINNYAASIINGTIDVYVTTSRMSAMAITRQFANVPPEVYWFNSTLLSAANDTIVQDINSLGGNSVSTTPSLFGSTSGAAAGGAAAPTGAVSSSGSGGSSNNYLIATILNADSVNGQLGTTQAGSGNNSTNNGGSANTGLAMIILYAITGCVTLLFLIVITSGAVRAMRHPERYGPRARDGAAGEPGQSRAGGLAKAVLDTFPVVKFFSGGEGGPSKDSAAAARELQDRQVASDNAIKDEEADLEHVEIHQMPSVGRSASMRDLQDVPMYPPSPTQESSSSARPRPSSDSAAKHPLSQHAQEVSASETLVDGTGITAHRKDATSDSSETQVEASHITAVAGGNQAASTSSHVDNTDPNQVNDSITCPICLLDFEDGDDIRILPCDSRHRFHDACVVPWLLNVSSLCPLCRLDLSKESAAAAVTSATETEAVPASANGSERPSVTRNRRSRLLSFSSSRNLTATAPAAAANDDTIPEEGQQGTPPQHPLTTTDSGTANAANSEGEAPTASRFMRYVQQRRARVRSSSTTRVLQSIAYASLDITNQSGTRRSRQG